MTGPVSISSSGRRYASALVAVVPPRTFTIEMMVFVVESVEGVLEDLQADLNGLTAGEGFLDVALTKLDEFLDQMPRYPGNPDPIWTLGIGDPNLPGASPYAAMRISEIKVQIADGGELAVRLGHQWIVFLFALWDETYRPRLAAAHGCDKNDIKAPILGDLRRLRNDVVHHAGIATTRNTGKCEVLQGWFQPGDLIVMTGHLYNEFIHAFPWTELAVSPRAP